MDELKDIMQDSSLPNWWSPFDDYGSMDPLATEPEMDEHLPKDPVSVLCDEITEEGGYLNDPCMYEQGRYCPSILDFSAKPASPCRLDAPEVLVQSPSTLTFSACFTTSGNEEQGAMDVGDGPESFIVKHSTTSTEVPRCAVPLMRLEFTHEKKLDCFESDSASPVFESTGSSFRESDSFPVQYNQDDMDALCSQNTTGMSFSDSLASPQCSLDLDQLVQSTKNCSEGIVHPAQGYPLKYERGSKSRPRFTQKPPTTAGISLDDLKAVFHLHRPEAERRLNLKRTTFSNLSRHYGIAKWPFRTLRDADNRIVHNETLLMNGNLSRERRNKILTQQRRLKAVKNLMYEEPCLSRDSNTLSTLLRLVESRELDDALR